MPRRTLPAAGAARLLERRGCLQGSLLNLIRLLLAVSIVLGTMGKRKAAVKEEPVEVKQEAGVKEEPLGVKPEPGSADDGMSALERERAAM